MHKVVSTDDIENSKTKSLTCVFDENIDGINAVTPVHAQLTFKSLGEFIEVVGNVKGIVKLECDLCLKEFEYELDFEIDELFAKHALIAGYEESGMEFELKDGQFCTDLNGEKEIDIYDLLYQSVILNLPNRKVCGINCMGDNFLKEENLPDSRMDVFKNIKIDENK